MIASGFVHIVDDDEQALKAVKALMDSMGLESCCYSSAETFLKSFDGRRPACLVTDVRMLGMSGLELQERLNQLGVSISVVVLTAFASTHIAVQAMRNGALTLMEKPCDDNELWNAVREGLNADRERCELERQRDAIADRLATLTPKERQVFDLIVAGDANKVAARKLGVSIRTVEVHRSKVFEKMEADSVAALVRMAMTLDDLNNPSSNF